MSSIHQIFNINRSGMLALLQGLDGISNNLANVNTVGFKTSRSNFQEMLSEQIYGGTQIRTTQMKFSQGRLRETGNGLDAAIEGEGFFIIQMPDGENAYTRNGEFYLDQDLQVVNSDGFLLDWEGSIPADAEDVHINPDGTVMVKQGDVWSEAGSIPLASFPNPGGLQIFGRNLYLETEVSGEAQIGTPNTEPYGKLVGGAVEEANVDIAEEMSYLISMQRSFEMSLRSFQQTDQMMSQIINIRQG
jgi:flagellar basal-body rod protein FlgG